jgi:hypothetical protein
MRKIERLMNAAITEGRDWKSGNTEVVNFFNDKGELAVTEIRLHGNLIAEVSAECVTLHDGGWQSVTTKSRLNAILSQHGLPGEGIFQHKWEWFCRLWNGTEHFTVPFRSGMRLA